MALRFLDDGGYQLGMVRDQPSWLLPPGAVYDAQNILWDRPGIARQRGGTTALVSGSQTAAPTTLGFCYSQDSTPIEELYGFCGKDGSINLVNKTTGAFTQVIAPSTAGVAGRPVRHFGYVFFPVRSTSAAASRVSWGFAGQTNTTAFLSTSAVTVTAAQQQITLAGADTTTNIKVGACVTMLGATGEFVGRVVSVDTATKFTVWPAPKVTFTTLAAGVSTSPAVTSYGGAAAASFQNRLLWGNTNDITSALGTLVVDRRVYYSPLPTESLTAGGGFVYDGAFFTITGVWPSLNYFEVPGTDAIVSMEPVGDNELLILTSTHPVLFRGNLVTQLATTTSSSVPFDISDIAQPAGCLSDLSVQRTAKGVVWAGADGVYAYQGSGRVVNLTGDADNKIINGYWRELLAPSTAVIHGSMYVRGHYVVSGSSGGTTFSFACDLTGSRPKWTRLSGAGTDIFYGLPRPTIPGQVFTLRWWDVAGAAPSMTNGQTVRAETMFDSYTSGTKTDADATAVAVSLTTRVMTGDTETQKLWQRGTIRYQQASTTAAMTVTAQSKVDAADISAASVRTLGSLSNTSVLTVSGATNATPIVITTSANHGLQSDDFVDIDGITGNTNANGRWRIAVVSVTTFSLVGSAGNGAFGGSPTCKKLTETDFLISTLNAGQGASVLITGSPNNFELHGVRLGMLERPPVMSS